MGGWRAPPKVMDLREKGKITMWVLDMYDIAIRHTSWPGHNAANACQKQTLACTPQYARHIVPGVCPKHVTTILSLRCRTMLGTG